MTNKIGLISSNILGAITRTGLIKNNTTAMSNTSTRSAGVQEINLSNATTGNRLYVDSNYNLSLENDRVYSIQTNYGLTNYKFHAATATTDDYVQLLYFDNHMSDQKRVVLERTRQFLQDLQTFAKTGNAAYLDTARENSEVLAMFETFGITPDTPFTLNGNPHRYRIDDYGLMHDVDLETSIVRETDWRKYGYNEDTIFVAEGVEYRMNENGKLPFPNDFVYKYEKFQTIKSPK